MRWPSMVIVLSVIAVSSSMFLVSDLKINNSVDVFFDKQSPSFTEFQKWKQQFGSDQIVVIAFADEDIFTSENLTLISRVTKKIESLKYVDEVTSLTNVNDIKPGLNR